MSRYRDDTESLKAEVERLRAERDVLDRRLCLGPYAATSFGRVGYRLGRRLARRLARRRPRGPADASADLLRARRDALERELASLERSLAVRARGPDAPAPPPSPPSPSPPPQLDWARRVAPMLPPPPPSPPPPAPPDGWAHRTGMLIGRAFRRWRGR